MRFKFLQATQVDHSQLRRSGRALPPPRPPSPMVDLWQVYFDTNVFYDHDFFVCVLMLSFVM